MRLRSTEKQVHIPIGSSSLRGILSLPSDASDLIVVAHTIDRASPENYISDGISVFAKLELALLTPEEQTLDLWTRKLRFDVDFLSGRLATVLIWLANQKATRYLKIGLIGTQLGATIATLTAARCPKRVTALALCSGKLDMAFEALSAIQVPTLFIVGGKDRLGIISTKMAFNHLHAPKKLEIIPMASELLEEPGALEVATQLLREWFQFHFLSSAVGGG